MAYPYLHGHCLLCLLYSESNLGIDLQVDRSLAVPLTSPYMYHCNLGLVLYKQVVYHRLRAVALGTNSPFFPGWKSISSTGAVSALLPNILFHLKIRKIT